MNKEKEIEMFLRYLIDIYSQNSDLPLSYKTIYAELVTFYTFDNKQERLDFDSLVGVQVKLKNKFSNVSDINQYMSKDGNFFAIENRLGKKDDNYINDIYNGIKLYIAVSPDDIYKVSELLINFTINNGIVMQSKIAKEMRNDALVCRVSNSSDAIKICDYINGLNYKSDVKPNPFILDNGKVGIVIDGTLSYNATLSRLLKEYLWVKRTDKTVDKIAHDKEFNISQDFNKFIKSQIEFLNSSQKKAFMDLYEIDNEVKFNDFIMICEIISKRLNNNITMEELFLYQADKKSNLGNKDEFVSYHNEDKIKYVMSILANYYSLEHVHKLIMEFINTGDYNLFSRDYGGIRNIIRNILENNFSKADVKDIISNLGWNALIDVSKVTYDKYGEDQLFGALKNLFNDYDKSLFTNDNESRSYLAFIIPPELLKSIIVCKLEENGMNISSISLAQLIMDEISLLE